MTMTTDFLDLLKDHIIENNCCPEIPLTVQFCCVLNFYYSGSYQRRVGADVFAMVLKLLMR